MVLFGTVDVRAASRVFGGIGDKSLRFRAAAANDPTVQFQPPPMLPGAPNRAGSKAPLSPHPATLIRPFPALDIQKDHTQKVAPLQAGMFGMLKDMVVGGSKEATVPAKDFYALNPKALSGGKFPFSKLKGKTVLITNVASQ
jgi:hypothetical protein